MPGRPQTFNPISIRTAAVTTAAVLWFTPLTGCQASGPLPATPDIILDRSLNESRRADAIQAISLDDEAAPEALVALHLLAWSDRHPLALRTMAVDRLIARDADMFWRSADRWLVTVDAPGMVRAIGKRAVADGRSDAAAAFLRRWAVPQKGAVDLARPEAQIFRRLVAPVPLREALWQRVIQPPSPDRPEAEHAWPAWAVWCRLSNESTIRQRLAEEPASTPLLDDLRTASAVVDRLPRNDEELRWLRALRKDQAQWDRWSGLREHVHPDQRGHLELRHLPVLARLSQAELGLDHSGWRDAVAAQLQGAATFVRERPAGRAVRVNQDGRVPLSAADLAVVHAVADAMRDPLVVLEWFTQADADRADETTEHGGVLDWGAGPPFVVKAFPPTQKQGDQKFFSPPELIGAMYTGLAHYHFHAQEYDNASYAGPGRGDLEFADALQAHTLTLTFVDRDRLNVDLAFPGGLVLDLGCIERPVD